MHLHKTNDYQAIIIKPKIVVTFIGKKNEVKDAYPSYYP